MDAGTPAARPRAPVGPSHQGEALPEKTQMGRPLTEKSHGSGCPGLPDGPNSLPLAGKSLTRREAQSSKRTLPAPNVLKQENSMWVLLDNGRIVKRFHYKLA
ncbi:hypothetical protein QQF64_026644 [Cirrhinus molitorella]|uniref:Uncharacterized protein n=1 Tax=Cirrhinus molitorella TaxID=172907 RepID=A0ABR3NA70_9TELE